MDDQLAEVLKVILLKVDQLERQVNSGRQSTPIAEGLAGALSALSRGGQPAPQSVEQVSTRGTDEPEPQPPRPQVFSGFAEDDSAGVVRLPNRVAPSQRPIAPAVPRPGIDFQIEVPAGRYERAPVPREAAVEGQQFIQCLGDQWVQVRSEDGILLGAMPTFGSDIQIIFTEQRQQLAVGMLAIRTVVVPYNQQIDPRDIHGFVAAPGLQRGPLQTGPVGRQANLDNPDIARQV